MTEQRPDEATPPDDALTPYEQNLAKMFKAHDFDRMSCGHVGHKQCCPGGCHDVQLNQYEHYAELVKYVLGPKAVRS